ncbi:MAG: poly-beta-1,6-N-acetyl-D-glucosamine N-deacetylase PgaB [Arhodomonas sp.]|nr:poly-beta-1,6-N-acetyl-D-glucosamine N-deacetylase PgaB [Arhodomonas sp.]
MRSVYLQAFADPDGDGNAAAMYFPNRHLPVRADLFNRVAWQLRTRAGVRVYAWMPLLAFDLPEGNIQLRVTRPGPDGKPVASGRNYRRLSPFLPETLAIVREIYADLGRAASGIHGVLIHDDAYLAEDEDLTACRPDARWPGRDRPLGATAA